MGKTAPRDIETEGVKRLGFLQRTSLYGFELFTALFGLVTTLIVVDYGLFTLFNYFRDLNTANAYVGEATIWVVAAMIVWLPVTLGFYLRSRSEYERHPLHQDSVLHKVLVSIYYVSLLFGAIGLSFAAIYALVHLAVSPDESVTDVLVRVTVPAIIATLLHVGMMMAYPKSKRPSRKLFATTFGVIATSVTILLFVVSAGYVRDSKQDEITVSDLNALEASITSYAAEHKALPEQTDIVKANLSEGTKARLGKYAYTIEGTDRYKLCADFKTATPILKSDGSEVTPMKTESDGTTSSIVYSSYVNFSSHAKGEVCFKVQIYGNYQPLSADTTLN